MHCYELSISSTQFRIKINLPGRNWDSCLRKLSFCRLLELQREALARDFLQFHTVPRLAILWRAGFLYLFALVLVLNKCLIFLLLALKERKYVSNISQNVAEIPPCASYQIPVVWLGSSSFGGSGFPWYFNAFTIICNFLPPSAQHIPFRELSGRQLVLWLIWSLKLRVC